MDRIFFVFYLTTFLLSSYLLTNSFQPYSLHVVFFLAVLSLLWLNLFFITQWDVRDIPQYRREKFFSFFLLPFSFSLAALFYIDYRPELFEDTFYFPHPLFPAFTLISAVLSLLMLTMGWERLERMQDRSKGERIFRMGVILWWLVFFFLLCRMIYAGEAISITLLNTVFCFHVIWIAGIYGLIFKGTFLEVRAHPSPQLAGRATQSLLILAVLTLFFWFEALSRKWDFPPYSATIISVIALTAILLFPLFPFRPFESFRRMLYHHLYLPEQDFALEVSLYLKVMRGKGDVASITDHLQKRLGIESVLLYRAVKGSRQKWKIHQSSPRPTAFPTSLTVIPVQGAQLGPLPVVRVIPLDVRDETLGCLLLLGKQTRFHFEEESLIRFWTRTLGLLLRELEQREKEKEQERLAHFSQATSFLLHDAKNLAQLLDLLLKNSAALRGDDLIAFFNDSLPALEQARSRSRRILERLETFQPDIRPVVQDSDISQILKNSAASLQTSFKRQQVLFHEQEKSAPWKGDPLALETVMENLVLNGLQAGGKEEKVEILLDEKNNGYHIQVKDEGTGIPEENREQMFEPFFTTKQGGSGLGLYQARVLIEKMNGEIWYEPNSPQGSVFHVRLSHDTSR
ncbi:MAG: hypothetical protein JXD19_08990 [Deltaproteobacteria bacterium]|nr:hypothetical protein [Deltaproteobacteria bacterium]